MSKITTLNEETYVEEPFLAHLERLGWKIAHFKRSEGKGYRSGFGDVILDEELKSALKKLNRWLTDSQIENISTKLHTFEAPSLLEKNREGDNRLHIGLSAYNEETGEDNIPVKLIDYATPENNRFLAVSQFRIQQFEKEIIADIVLFVNGLPLVVVECKSSKLRDPIYDGAIQMDRYKNDFPELFNYNQFVVSTCRQTAKYTTITGIGAVESYLEWKEPFPYSLSEIDPSGSTVTSQEQLVWGMLSPANFLDIIHNYIVWDGSVKKAPRYMQYRGARKLVERIRTEKKGGTIWHTQGSGKSLTMMYVIRQMFHSDDLNDWKIVLIVDRENLEKQIEKTCGVIGYPVNLPAESIADCEAKIRNSTSDITIAMIHKFRVKTDDHLGEQNNTDNHLGELNNSDKILIMIDEAHRSEYGELAASMTRAMPNAVKVAFSGTPITRTTDTFGGIIDKYTMRQAEEDGVVVGIRYEGRATDGVIIDEEAMNGKFIDIFGYADDAGKPVAKQEDILSGYMEAEAVIHAKAADMLEHYIGTVFPNGFKAQVAAFSREAAYRYREAFRSLLKIKVDELKVSNPLGVDIARLEKMEVECIISSNPNDEIKYPHLYTMTRGTDKERIVGENGKFKTPFDKGGNVGIVIVSDMLLTGFDAPIEQVLYLDKKLTNHSLLQAIARVNRVYGANKKCGYVVDYVGIAQHLKKALAEYADLKDGAGEPMIDVSVDIDRLNAAYNEICSFIKQKICYDYITQPESVIEELVADEELRNTFNELFKTLSTYYDRVLPSPVALDYRDAYARLAFIRESVANRTRDPRYSMKDASAKVRAIIEEHLRINGVGLEIPPINILSNDFIDGVEKPDKRDRAAVNEMEYAIREYITDNSMKDPELFEQFSERLEKILEDFKNNWKSLRAALVELIKNDLRNARKNENTYGYEAEHEMPFFSMLRKEVFIDKKFEDLSEDEFNALKEVTDDCLSRLKTDAAKRDFWRQEMKIRQMRTTIRTRLRDMERIAPNIKGKLNDIVQKIVELGKVHFNERNPV